MMKKLALAFLVSAPMMASAASQYVTVEVCDGGESGTLCRTVTYKVRPASKPEVVECKMSHGEAGEVPCLTEGQYGVPE